MLNHNYIGTEHILLGLVHENEGVAAKSLEALGISLSGVREQVTHVLGKGQSAPTGHHIPFTPRAKKVLELSLREALQLGHNYIGTEHLLLGLIREGEGVAAQVLERMGAGLDRVRAQVIAEMGVTPLPHEEDPETRHLRLPSKALSVETAETFELASAVAAWFRHETIKPSDLFWGLLRAGDPEVARILTELGLDLE